MKTLLVFQFLVLFYIQSSMAQGIGAAQKANRPSPVINTNINVIQPEVNPPADAPLTSQGLGRRDPFSLPIYIINKLKMLSAPPPPVANRIDDTIEPLRRWALVSYNLIGVIWDVKNPKALVRDQQGHVHLIKIKDRIGYDNGIVTDIREGSITVIEDKTPQVMRLKK
ncbi:MAG: pilus assembly protein PilP [Pseudobdellovibrio sp.]